MLFSSPQVGREAEEPGRAPGQHVKRTAGARHPGLRLPDRPPALPEERRPQAARGGSGWRDLRSSDVSYLSGLGRGWEVPPPPPAPL